MDGVVILSIETATGCGSVALTRGTRMDGRVLAECTCQPEVTHSRRLLGSIQWALESIGITWQELDGIAISLGPGSFTGLRIGMAAAKGIVMATGVPLLGVPSLDGLAAQCCGMEQVVYCLLDARKNQVYGACYRPGDGVLERVGEFFVLEPQQLLDSLEQPAYFVGPGIVPFADFFAADDRVKLLPQSHAYPRAAQIGFLGAELLEDQQLLDPAIAAPMYVRASDAEIQAKKKND